jgi:hypothetical protein
MEQLDTFLARHPPFDGLDPATLGEIAADSHERSRSSSRASASGIPRC